MIKAYLRIDDSPSEITPDFVDYLADKNITPIIFAVGENIEKHFDNAVYALQKGAVIGNHSHTHPDFSKLSLEQAVDEIEKCETLLDKVYECAGVKREHKLFAFPYGNKGEQNKNAIQQYLKAKGFARVDDTAIQFDWYKQNGLDKDIDSFWTFDLAEYQLQWNNGFTYESILERIHDKHPKDGGALLQENSNHIILIHDHFQTNVIIKDYYKTLIDYLINAGVTFVRPEFKKENF